MKTRAMVNSWYEEIKADCDDYALENDCIPEGTQLYEFWFDKSWGGCRHGLILKFYFNDYIWTGDALEFPLFKPTLRLDAVLRLMGQTRLAEARAFIYPDLPDEGTVVYGKGSRILWKSQEDDPGVPYVYQIAGWYDELEVPLSTRLSRQKEVPIDTFDGHHESTIRE